MFYNLIMALCGYLSIQIAAVSIPLLYILIGVSLNIGYSMVWLIDLELRKRRHHNSSRTLYIIYLVLSILLVIGFSFYLLL